MSLHYITKIHPIVRECMRGFSKNDVDFFLINSKKLKNEIIFKHEDPAIFNIKINYTYVKQGKVFKAALKFSWIYEQEINTLGMIDISELHKNLLSYIFPILKISSKTNIFQSSELEVYFIKNKNSLKQSLLLEARDCFYFASFLKGNLEPKKESTPHMDLLLKMFPTGLTQIKSKTKRFNNYIPKSFKNITLKDLLTIEKKEKKDNFNLFNLQILNSQINTDVLQEVYSTYLQSIIYLEFGFGEYSYRNLLNSDLNNGNINSSFKKDKTMSLSLYSTSINGGCEVAYISPIFENFFE